MDFHRLGANTKQFGNLFSQVASNHEFCNFAFPNGQQLHPLRYLTLPIQLSASFQFKCDHFPYDVDKQVVMKWFFDHGDRPHFHGLHRHRHRSIPRHQQERNHTKSTTNLLDQLQTGHFRHLKVDH